MMNLVVKSPSGSTNVYKSIRSIIQHSFDNILIWKFFCYSCGAAVVVERPKLN